MIACAGAGTRRRLAMWPNPMPDGLLVAYWCMSSPEPAVRSQRHAESQRRWRRLTRWCGALVLVAAAAYIGHEVALQTGLTRLREAAEHRLDMLATGLDADLARFEYLPALLEMTPVVPALLDAPSPELRDTVNHYLNGVNATAGAEMLYVLDPAGTSLAASDWDQPGTTIGQDLSFRPYVIDALKSGRGRLLPFAGVNSCMWDRPRNPGCPRQSR